MIVYKALQLSLLTYAASAWQPWAAPSRIEQLERCQNKALMVVTGTLKSTPVETLRREAGICSIATASKRVTARGSFHIIIIIQRRESGHAPSLERLLPSHAGADICKDSQSLLKAIQSGSADTTYLRRMLNKRVGKTTLL